MSVWPCERLATYSGFTLALPNSGWSGSSNSVTLKGFPWVLKMDGCLLEGLLCLGSVKTHLNFCADPSLKTKNVYVIFAKQKFLS